MLDTNEFKGAYEAPRNGTERYHRNPLYPNFLYSDGVHECAEAGCYWLLDKLGTELPAVFNKHDVFSLLIEVDVGEDDSAVIRGMPSDVGPALYYQEIDFTDMPHGNWNFFVARDGDKLICILLTEY